MVGLDHLIVIIQNTYLENTETFGAVQRDSQIHAGLIIFQLGAPSNDAVNGNVQRSAEIKGDIGSWSETIKIAQPVRRTSTSAIARKCGVDIAVGENQITAVQQRHDLAFTAVSKICSVQKRKRRRCQQAPLFAPPGCRVHEWRRSSLCEVVTLAADFEPAFQQVEWGVLPGTVNPFNHH